MVTEKTKSAKAQQMSKGKSNMKNEGIKVKGSPKAKNTEGRNLKESNLAAGVKPKAAIKYGSQNIPKNGGSKTMIKAGKY